MENGTQLRVLGGKYRLVRKLESGGMGSVWYAEHLVLSSPVAVKLLELEDQSSAAALPRFLREAQMAASLRSPHVVQILDYGVDEQTPYIVMELLVGESLAVRLRRVTRLSPRETSAVVTQIARAVGRAHDAGIVHRDLKPANVFVVRDADVEVVKVLDFGIAKAQASTDGNTRSGTFLGTPLYASPEQTQGARALDHRTDVWSLGVIAFECLLGLRPFGGDTFGAIVLAVCVKPLPVPSTCGAVPLGFDDWFAQACARDPDQRFSSVRQAAEALAKLCAGELVADLGSTHNVAREAHERASSMAHAATAPELDESNATHRAASISREPELPSERGRARWRWAAALGLMSSALTGVLFLSRSSEAPRATTVTSLGAPAPVVEAEPPASRAPAVAVADAGAPVTTALPPTPPSPPQPKSSRPAKTRRRSRPAPVAREAEPEVDLGL
jgi:eukaryotic-like serine/threonine-protein kinase